MPNKLSPEEVEQKAQELNEKVWKFFPDWDEEQICDFIWAQTPFPAIPVTDPMFDGFLLKALQACKDAKEQGRNVCDMCYKLVDKKEWLCSEHRKEWDEMQQKNKAGEL